MNECTNKNMKLTAQDYDTCISQRLRPNSPADKYVIKKCFVSHSNSMKLGEVLVNINIHNFTNFH